MAAMRGVTHTLRLDSHGGPESISDFTANARLHQTHSCNLNTSRITTLQIYNERLGVLVTSTIKQRETNENRFDIVSPEKATPK